MKSKKRFVRKGNVVVLKEAVEDQELSSKDVLINIMGLKGAIDKAKNDIKAKEEEVVYINKEITRLTPLLSSIKKFEGWADRVQSSLVKSLVKELLPGLKVEVDSEYKEDPGMTSEGNVVQRMAQLQNKFGRHPSVAEKLAPITIKKNVYENCVFGNPWKNT